MSQEKEKKPATRRAETTSRNPYMNFLMDFRKENRNLGAKEIFRTAGERWQQMSSAEKEPYVEAARSAPRQKRRTKRRKKVNFTRKKRRRSEYVCNTCGHRIY